MNTVKTMNVSNFKDGFKSVLFSDWGTSELLAYPFNRYGLILQNEGAELNSNLHSLNQNIRNNKERHIDTNVDEMIAAHALTVFFNALPCSIQKEYGYGEEMIKSFAVERIRNISKKGGRISYQEFQGWIHEYHTHSHTRCA